jgi:RNA polymerase sigma-70 factor (ECF subfamily)
MSTTRDLLRRCHQGDAGALAELVATDAAWITALVQRRLGPALRARVDTQDIVQNTMLEVLRSAPRFEIDDREQLRALLARLVENVLRHQARRDHQQVRDVRREQPLHAASSADSVLQLSNAGQPGPATAAAAGEQRDWIRLALELLDPDDRDAIVWREFDGEAFAVIAARLGLSEAHARVRFQRALPKLGRTVLALQQGQLARLLG